MSWAFLQMMKSTPDPTYLQVRGYLRKKHTISLTIILDIAGDQICTETIQLYSGAAVFGKHEHGHQSAIGVVILKSTMEGILVQINRFLTNNERCSI